jgi:hypothetical protein
MKKSSKKCWLVSFLIKRILLNKLCCKFVLGVHVFSHPIFFPIYVYSITSSVLFVLQGATYCSILLFRIRFCINDFPSFYFPALQCSTFETIKVQWIVGLQLRFEKLIFETSCQDDFQKSILKFYFDYFLYISNFLFGTVQHGLLTVD